MKLLFVDHVGVLGGAELYLLELARRYAATSRVLLFADGPLWERLQEVGVAVEVLSAPAGVTGVSREEGAGRSLRAVPGVLGLVGQVARRARRFDLIYANSQKAFVVCALAGQLARRPILWHLHDILTAEHFSAANRKLVITLANRFAARVFANSQATADAFMQGGGRAELVRVVPNGIDPAPFERVTPEEVAALRKGLGLEGVRVVSVFSRLAPWKGQHVLLEALKELPEVHALLVGEALFGEADYAHALEDKVKNSGLQDRVHFLGFRRDIPALMKLSDVVVHTSTAPEPFGRVIVEAMMAGRPVVATAAGGAREILDQKGSGLLVTPGDAGELSRTLSHLLAHPGEAARLAEAGKRAAIERYSLQAVLEETADEMRQVTTR